MAKVLVFLTDAFGGRGGIAQFNRDLLTSLSSNSAYTKVVALPRVIFDAAAEIPEGLTYRTASARGKVRYALHAARATVTERYDAVICSHINLLPIAAAAAATLTRITLELGGKSASVVLADTSDELFAAAVKVTVGNCYLNGGQTCTDRKSVV